MNCPWTQLLTILPEWLQQEVAAYRHDFLQEIRLRIGQPGVLITSEARILLHREVQRQDLTHLINLACRYSPWTAQSVAQGYLTVQGGHRIGLCGDAVVRGGSIRAIGTVTSVNIRVCRDFPGISRNLWLRKESILVLGPPGSGKTTLLRDLIRRRSQRETVAVVDERGEIFPSAANFYRGENTDVMTGCTKAQGIDMLLRTMTPACIAVDEITNIVDCDSVIQAGKCGVYLLATAHATSCEDLLGRPIYEKLVKSNLFATAVVMHADKSWRTERINLWSKSLAPLA